MTTISFTHTLDFSCKGFSLHPNRVGRKMLSRTFYYLRIFLILALKLQNFYRHEQTATLFYFVISSYNVINVIIMQLKCVFMGNFRCHLMFGMISFIEINNQVHQLAAHLIQQIYIYDLKYHHGWDSKIANYFTRINSRIEGMCSLPECNYCFNTVGLP